MSAPAQHWYRTVDPVDDPITLDEAKLQCRVDVDAEDVLFEEQYIPAAVSIVEEYLSRGLFTQTWCLVQDNWSDDIPLPRAAPLQSVSSVQYYAADGTLTTLSSDYYDTLTQEPASLVRKPDQVWPTLQSDRRGRIRITYVVGWASVDQIPGWAKQATLLLVDFLYKNRGSSDALALPASVSSILATHRVWLKPVVCA